MLTATFDTLAYAQTLGKAGFTREQATAQAEAFRAFAETMEEKIKGELATKGDLRETELRLQKEIEQVRLELELKIKNAENRLLTWQIGVGITLAAMMAKGFHWLGF